MPAGCCRHPPNITDEAKIGGAEWTGSPHLLGELLDADVHRRGTRSQNLFQLLHLVLVLLTHLLVCHLYVYKMCVF